MIIEKRLYAPKEVIVKNGGIIAMSLSSIYAGMKKGNIPFKQIGNRKLIPYWFLQKLLDSEM
ncbi:hypothetical protein [Megamonas hypermegale]|jgi:hypothetical protein|uniref:hypothetical protein n=1 Tax=Megamonas hypermegale TaxID=158847 RepID=UPI003208859D